jgi:hypothetical protein
LTRLFTDAEFRARFREDPQEVGRELGLDDAALASLERIDWIGLDLAARSYSHKCDAHAARKRRWWLFG